MTDISNLKLRAFGTASALAISSAFAMPAFAQSAPAPTDNPPPPPTAPAEPANIEQCTRSGQVITCLPGLDPDGAGESVFTPVGPAGPLTVNIQNGAYVKGLLSFGAVDVGENGVINNDGTIYGTSGFSTGATLGLGATLNNNGFVSSNGRSGVEGLQGSSIVNTGTIYGNQFGTFTFNVSVDNSGLIQSNSGGAIEIFSDPGTTSVVFNRVSGRIISNSGSGIRAGDNLDLTNDGLIQAFGTGSAAVSVGGDLTLSNSGNIVSETGRAIEVAGLANITNTATGLIESRGNDAIALGTDGSRVINNGLINAEGGFGIDAGGLADIFVGNNGTITSTDTAVIGGANLTVVNRTLVSSSGSDAIVGEGAGLTVRNLAAITAGDGDGVRGEDDVTVLNSGTITANGGDGVQLNSGLVDNFGSIVSASSNPANPLVSAGGAAELDAGIFFDNGIPGAENATVVNRAGASISGDVGIMAAAGNLADPLANAGSQQVYNYGTITGRQGSAALLGAGNDFFYTINAGTENGIVDGGAGVDRMFVLVTNDQRKDFNLSGIDSKYLNFERIVLGTLNFDPYDTTLSTAGTGQLVLGGTTSRDLVIANGAQLAGTVTGQVTLASFQKPSGGPLQPLDFRVVSGGSVNVAGSDAVVVQANGYSVINDGLIRSNGGDAIDATGRADIFVGNNGTIEAGTGGDRAIVAGSNLRVVNRGTISAASANAIEGGDALFLRNFGTVASLGGTAVVGGPNANVENLGLLDADAGPAVSIASGTVTNSGTIRSDDPGAFTPAVLFTAGTGAGTVTNAAGATIIGNVGVLADPANTGAQTIVNFGTITGRGGNAVLTGFGNDVFDQRAGASVNGDIRLGDGNDTFILSGRMSSINGTVSGGPGTDLALLNGIFDGDNIAQFETYVLGRNSNVTVVGNRTVTGGNIVVEGKAFFNLGLDSLTTTNGGLTLANGSEVVIATPLDYQLVGQTVDVLRQGNGSFTNNGGKVTILDNDLLIDYQLVSPVRVRVTAANPVVNSADPNIARFGSTMAFAINSGTLSQANFTALNALPNAQAYERALADALPSLSEGVDREIFESSSAASQALDRHLATDGSSLWGQVIVRGAEQDALSLSAGGYDSDQMIFTVGGDILFGNSAKVGVLASYADIDSTDLGGSTTPEASEVESLKLGLYTAVEFMNRGFFNAEVGYLTGNIESARSGFFGSIVSDYDFDGITARAALGYDLLPDENVAVVPSIGVNAARINFDDVTETGGFGFTVERGDAEYIELRGGVTFAAQLSEMVDGFISGTVVKDLVDTTRSFTLSSSQLTPFFVELPLRERDRFELNAGVSVGLSESFSLDVGYQGDFNDGYRAHDARATARIAF